MDTIVEEYMVRNDVPGMSIAISKDDRLVCAKGYGLADRETATPVTIGSRFRIASISKPVTAVAVFRLIEHGALRLTDRVFGPGSFLGERYGTPPPQNHANEITIEHLLAHITGGWTNDENDPMFLNREMDHAQLIAWTLDNQPLRNPPGSAYAYSNFGYCLLGRVIEQVTGMQYDDAARQEVLEPCGIRGMTIARNTREERQIDEVVYYGQDGDDPYEPNVSRMDSHGGWLASATDLVRFAVHVNGVDGVPDILSPDSIRVMTRGSEVNPSYALGWAVNEAGAWWHGGSLPGTATLLMRKSNGLCWAVLTNTRRPGLGAELDGLIQRIVEATEWPSHDLF